MCDVISGHVVKPGTEIRHSVRPCRQRSCQCLAADAEEEVSAWAEQRLEIIFKRGLMNRIKLLSLKRSCIGMRAGLFKQSEFDACGCSAVEG